jgi:kexin
MVVQFSAETSTDLIEALETDFDLQRAETIAFLPNTYIYTVSDPLDTLPVANQIHFSGKAVSAYPNWIRARSRKWMPNDPLFNEQWHLQNTGQSGGTAGEDVNICPVWDAYVGSEEEVIAIVDDGLEVDHKDLRPNIIAGESWDFVSNDDDPTPMTSEEIHGTACAGVAAARGNNALGVTGAAPEAGLVGIRLLSKVGVSIVQEAEALTFNGDVVDIYSNSWGVPDDGGIEGPAPLVQQALAAGARDGRGGLGSIYVWAGGNGYYYYTEDSNTDGYANNRYTIAVAASTHDGIQTSYSETGANIFINAPSNDFTRENGYSGGIVTTDRTGPDGYAGADYYAGFGGTSAVAPLVSGIIALMLEANPGLTWRDVHHILLQTAEQNDSSDGDWSLNGAGVLVNHKYGFGRVDALAAVTAAETWISVPDERSPPPTAVSAPGKIIPDNDATGVSDTIDLAADVAVEYVQVCLNISNHNRYGDLNIVLTSPEETQSVLAPGNELADMSYTYNDWCFGSVRHYGETSRGPWRLTVRDQGSVSEEGTLESWRLTLYGAGCTQRHNIWASATNGGTISSAGTVAVPQGWNRVFTLRPDPGWEVADVVVDAASMGAITQYTFSNVSAAHTIAAVFEATGPLYTIAASAGVHGTIHPSGDVTVVSGYDQTFRFKPDTGYEVSAIIVDGRSVPVSERYQFENVTADHTLKVTFAPPYRPSSHKNDWDDDEDDSCFLDTLFN